MNICNQDERDILGENDDVLRELQDFIYCLVVITGGILRCEDNDVGGTRQIRHQMLCNGTSYTQGHCNSSCFKAALH
jgi:hypothetical protein